MSAQQAAPCRRRARSQVDLDGSFPLQKGDVERRRRRAAAAQAAGGGDTGVSVRREGRASAQSASKAPEACGQVGWYRGYTSRPYALRSCDDESQDR